MHIPRLRTWVVLLVAASILMPIQASAQSTIQVSRDEAQLDFPTGIHFFITASSQSEIQAVTLLYGTNRQTCQPGQALTSIKVTPGKQVELDWQLEFVRSGIIPPGVELWWQWEIQNAAGNKLQTERQTVVVNDQRQDWQSLSEGLITVQWYEGSRAFGQHLLDVSTTALKRMEQEQGLEYSDPIWITIYPSYEALRDALVTSAEWTGGRAFPDYSAILLGVPLDQASYADDALPHELNHLVVLRLTFNCTGASLPQWLSEGLAMFAEGTLPESSRQDVLNSLEADKLPTLRSLAAGFSAYSDQANLSYNQSEMVVGYLIDTHGPEHMRSLLDTIASGKTIDEALNEVYTLDTDGVDAAWRESLGFSFTSPDRAAAQSEASATPVPTFALWTPVLRASATISTTLSISPTLTITPSPSASPTPRPTPTPLPAPRGAPWLWGGLTALILVAAAALTLAILDLVVYRKRRKENKDQGDLS